jgi:hypothetical protein
MSVYVDLGIQISAGIKEGKVTSAPTENSPETAGFAAIAEGVNFVFS